MITFVFLSHPLVVLVRACLGMRPVSDKGCSVLPGPRCVDCALDHWIYDAFALVLHSYKYLVLLLCLQGLDAFAERWIYGRGCPRFTLGMRYSKLHNRLVYFAFVGWCCSPLLVRLFFRGMLLAACSWHETVGHGG